MRKGDYASKAITMFWEGEELYTEFNNSGENLDILRKMSTMNFRKQ